MEKKTKKKAAKTILALIVIAYLILIGPPSITTKNGNQTNQSNSDAIVIGTRKTVTHGVTIMNIPEKYSSLSPGDELVVETRLREFDFNNKSDVIIDYEITDSEEKTVLRQRETVALQTQASFLKTFTLPTDLSFGSYTVHGTIKELDEKLLATATTSFDIAKPIVGYSQSEIGWTISKNTLAVLSFLTIMMLLLMLFRNIKYENNAEKKIFSSVEKPDYHDLIEVIIKQNHFFGGEKSIKLANRIKGLKVNEKGRVVALKENGLETMVNLIDLYRISVGQSSIRIAREAIKDILIFNPSLAVPDELKI